MVALAAYFDESKNDKGTLAIAGYVSSVETWDSVFSPMWWDALGHGPSLVPEFKASDCSNGFGSFKGWTPDERTALTSELVDIIGTDLLPLIGVGTVVSVGFAPTLEKQTRYEHVGYYFCLQNVVQQVLKFCSWCGEDDTIQFIFDERDDLAFRASQLFGNIIENAKKQAKFKGKVRKLHFAPSSELAPLQAADLLAYETFKEFKNRFEDPDRDVRMALHRLVAEKPHYAEAFTEDGMRYLVMMLNSIDEGDKPGQLLAHVMLQGEIGLLYCTGHEVPIRQSGGRRLSWFRRTIARWLMKHAKWPGLHEEGSRSTNNL